MEYYLDDFNENNYKEFQNKLKLNIKSFLYFVINPGFISQNSEFYIILNRILYYAMILHEADRRGIYVLTPNSRSHVSHLYEVITSLNKYHDTNLLSKVLNMLILIYYIIIALFLWYIFG